VSGLVPSPITGTEGNVEFLALLRHAADATDAAHDSVSSETAESIRAAVEEVSGITADALPIAAGSEVSR
jgi:hypothetical protein